MTDEMRQKLQDAGVDVPSAMDRFLNNEALLERFLRKFKDDKNYGELLAAVTEKDTEKAFAASHTLKGVSANLSLLTLQERVSEQCEKFRAKDFEGGAALMAGVTEEYERVVRALDELYQA